MANVVPLVDGELCGVLGPGVVGEEALDLVVRRDAARDVPASWSGNQIKKVYVSVEVI